MKKYDIFLSHRSIPSQKELARIIYYNGITNNITIWYDEDKLSYGDDLNEAMQKGIESSNGFLLLYSKEAKASANVLFEMDIARKKYEIDEFEYVYTYGDSSGDKEMLELAHEKHYKPFRD